ncbi:hypothetical protein QLX08_004349 [Tetragonisca angustula]|uniref:CCHC-type domain-containing protein n=1 Tax=Tetragonisca angustula TaxID=166442 RepID=A0AAW1A2X5_9HYME
MCSQVATSQFSLECLIKLLPESFDGDRYKLRSFIKQVDAVFELAQSLQTIPLLLYVKNKITGRAHDQIDVHCNLNTWGKISKLLIAFYQDRKSLDQLLEELSSISHAPHENVSQFYQRLEDLNSKILGAIYNSKCNEETLNGQLLMINNITLNRFVYHSHPAISQMLRYREFDNINKAFTAAIAEEKALRLIYKENFVRCRNCGRTNHITAN